MCGYLYLRALLNKGRYCSLSFSERGCAEQANFPCKATLHSRLEDFQTLFKPLGGEERGSKPTEPPVSPSAHPQYQFDFPTQHLAVGDTFPNLTSTGLPSLSTAAKKSPKSNLCLRPSHQIPPDGDIFQHHRQKWLVPGCWSPPNICRAHFPSPARGFQSSPLLGCLYKHVYLLCQHTLESKHIKRKRKQAASRGLSKPHPTAARPGDHRLMEKGLVRSISPLLSLPRQPQGSVTLAGRHP